MTGKIIRRALLGMLSCVGLELIVALSICKILRMSYVEICPPMFNEPLGGELNAAVALTAAVALLGLVLGVVSALLSRKK